MHLPFTRYTAACQVITICSHEPAQHKEHPWTSAYRPSMRSSGSRFAALLKRKSSPRPGNSTKRKNFLTQPAEPWENWVFSACLSRNNTAGQGMDYVSYIIAVEEIARMDGSHAATIAAGNSLGIGPLYYYGSEEQKKKYLPKLCTGRNALGVRADRAERRFRRRQHSDQCRLGRKRMGDQREQDLYHQCLYRYYRRRNGLGPDRNAGKPGKKNSVCILVETGTPGFQARPMHGKMMWRASNTSELYFEDCRVPKDNLLGPTRQGFHQMLGTLDGGRLSHRRHGSGRRPGVL